MATTNTTTGTSGNAPLIGTTGSDAINGGTGDDTIYGGAGSDTLSGGAGSDYIDGGTGSDKLVGGSGGDTLNGGSGSDIVNGDSGDDILVYNLDNNIGFTDIYTGGSGIDTIRLLLSDTQWHSTGVQAEIDRYLKHLAEFTKNGEVSNGSASDFTFNFTIGDQTTTLKVQMTETLDVWVNNTRIDYLNPEIRVVGGTVTLLKLTKVTPD